MERNLYLKILDLPEAQKICMEKLGDYILETEWIDVRESLNRVTSEPVYAKYNSPLFNAAAMDGICVIAKNTKEASENNPVTLKLGKDFQHVDTGDRIDFPYDAVIMAEDLVRISDDEAVIIKSAAPWQHIRPIGEDITACEMILVSNHQIKPVDIGVLLSGGITKIKVYKKLRAAVFATGTEIIEPEEEIKFDSIIDSNSYMFVNQLKELNVEGVRQGILKDDYNLIKEKLSKAADIYDLILINAGSSAGREDFTEKVIRELGEVFVHGVAIKPGKPVILGKIKNKPVVGIPGYPVSAFIVFENFVKPLISHITHQENAEPQIYEATVTKRVMSSLKYEEYVRIKVGIVEGKLVASPLKRGAGAAMSLVLSDGFCIIDKNSEGVEAEKKVKIFLNKPLNQVTKTLVAIGSHDLILDIISDLLPNKYPGHFLTSTHVGSMGGLFALRRKECHFTSCHILNMETGKYNEDIVKQIFDEDMVIIKGVKRVQGIIVPKGNPQNIQSVKDILGKKYINRQNGAGTRILFDYLLKENGIERSDIKGYEREVATHMAVCAAVKNGLADCGMGVFSAARAMDLDFIPIGNEEYDFVTYKKFLNSELMQNFIELLKNSQLREKLDDLGGYEFSCMGEIYVVSRD